MGYIRSYKEPKVWQKSVELTKEIYLITAKFPRSELYGLTSQMRRASVSVPSNIAEGYSRKSINAYTQFYPIAYGSAMGVRNPVAIS